MGKPLTVYQINQTIQERGYPPLPSDCRFIALNKELTEKVVIVPHSPMPKVFYLKVENGEVTAFRVDAWRAI